MSRAAIERMHRASVVSVWAVVSLGLLIIGLFLFVVTTSELPALAAAIPAITLWAGVAAWIVWTSGRWLRGARLEDVSGITAAQIAGWLIIVGSALALFRTGLDWNVMLATCGLLCGVSIWLWSESLILLRIIECLPSAARTGFERDLRRHRFMVFAVFASLCLAVASACMLSFLPPTFLIWQAWNVVVYHRRNAKRIRWYLAAMG